MAKASVQCRRVDVWFSQEQYGQLLRLRSQRETNAGRSVAVNELIRDLVSKAAIAEKAAK